MSIRIEKASEYEIEELTKLRIAYLQEDFGNIEEQDLHCMKETLPQYFKNHLNRDLVVFVAKENDEIVGFAGFSTCLDEASLNNIVVKKSHRNRGIGGELLESLIELCSQLRMKTFTLEVDIENEPAIHLYEKFGFKNLGIRKNYYNNSRDAFIMTKYDM